MTLAAEDPDKVMYALVSYSTPIDDIFEGWNEEMVTIFRSAEFFIRLMIT